MEFIPIKTRKFLPPKDNIFDLLDEHLPELQEDDILVIASKILGIHEGRCVKIKNGTNQERDELAKAEADYYIPREHVPNQMILPTIKHNTLIASSGIDKSNANGYYIFWPERPIELLKEIWQYLKKKCNITDLALITVDSHFVPLRVGSIGTSIAFFGFEPVIDYRGKPDIFGRTLEVSRVNIPDSLAAPAVLLMGEGDEQTPLLIIRNLKFVKFTDKDTYKNFIIKNEEDIYYPLLKAFKQIKR